jgi:predicted nucleic acid-binding protein
LRRSERALSDAGPLVALFDEEDIANEPCRAALDGFPGELATTWPALTEAFYFLRHKPGRERLWEFLSRGLLAVEDVLLSDLPRMRWFMTKYSDLPMDFADASLVVVAERLRLRKVFTLDHDFRVYRPRHVRTFEVFP